MVCSKDFENINIKMDDNALKQVPKFKYLGSKITEYGENTGDIMRRIKEAKVVFIVSPCIFIYLSVFTYGRCFWSTNSNTPNTTFYKFLFHFQTKVIRT